LILSKIVKIVATRCHFLREKCTKFDFGLGSSPGPVLGELTARKGPGKFLTGVLEKSWIFLLVKEWEPR